jgi:NADH-quinone oxidoreductase subunit N
MATVVKTAGIAALYRLFSNGFGDIQSVWSKSLMIVSALTLLVGNLAAVKQESAKRMLAYSSIAHAGYFLLAIFSLGNNSSNALLLYAAAYSFASVPLFLGMIVVQQKNGQETISAFNGLVKQNPYLAFAIALALFSMAGIPPAAGFMGKFAVFSAALSKDYVGIVVLAVITSCIGIYYYFKLIKAIYMQPPTSEETITITSTQKWVLTLSMLFTLLLGLAPQFILNLL